MKSVSAITIISLLILAIVMPVGLITPSSVSAQTLSSADRIRLQNELAQVEKEQKEAEATLASAQQQSASLQRDILILDTKIKAAQLNIKAKNLLIQTLGQDISTKEKKIDTLEARIERGKESLAQIMRKTRELDGYSIPQIILSQKTLTAALSDLDSFESVQLSMKATFEEIRSAKSQTETERDTLDKRRNQEMDARAAIAKEQKNIEQAQAERKQLLAVSKSTEKTYAQLLADRIKKAAEIRAALFTLNDGQRIPFNDVLTYATAASKITGVRPAFIIAILTQESDLGLNIGKCLVSSLETGDGVGKNSGTFFEQVMKAPRDTSLFRDITARFNRDWKTIPVSCPPGTKYYVGRGFGGGMGPSQFIPSTWELFKEQLASIFSIPSDAVDPWNPKHSFMATAVYMRDLGAGAGTYSAERNAACKYYSGVKCTTGRKPPNVFYGDDVMSTADIIQRTKIDPLQGV